ncbi:MAG: hypothetical protein M1418_10275 [Deltaproteobacteria bacterium]|nr:hypothetical protein [Deltaproteobacteria bacterium]
METKVCIYCHRTLESNRLLEKAGKYRCKDENDCLEYQNGADPADSADSADYISAVVKSSLSEAAQRIAAYKRIKEDRTKGGSGESGKASQEAIAGFARLKSVLDVLAVEYKDDHQLAFQYDETKNVEYRISLNDADSHLHLTVKMDNVTGSGYWLTVAGENAAADADPLYQEFIYKRYPGSQREDVIKDVSVILLAFAGEKDLRAALLNEFRMEIESRYYKSDE